MFMEEIDGVLNGFKCKYLYLDKLFNGKLDATDKKGERPVKNVCIYINLESVYNSFRSVKTEKRLNKMTEKEIKIVYRQVISNIINIAAHYRKYFSRHKIKTYIFYYYNEITDEYHDYNNTATCPGYREHFFDSLHDMNRMSVNGIVEEMLPFLKIITEYIEGVYTIEVKHVESSIVPFYFFMENPNQTNMNIIISKDIYDLQYTNYNSLVISRAGSEPVLITKRNVMKYLAWKFDMKMEKPLHPKLLPFILSCIGDKKRSIEKIPGRMGFKTVVRELWKLYDEGYIYDSDTDTMSIQNLLHVLNKGEYKLVKVESLASDIMSNFKAIDFEEQYRMISKHQKTLIQRQLVDKTDPGALQDINERYFEDFPIQVMELNQYSRIRSLKIDSDDN